MPVSQGSAVPSCINRVCVISELVLYLSHFCTLQYFIHAANYLCPAVWCMSGTSHHNPLAKVRYGLGIMQARLSNLEVPGFQVYMSSECGSTFEVRARLW